jgi:electron transfer flavoprotein alpha subunit
VSTVLTFVEVADDTITGGSARALTLARGLAAAVSGELHVAVVGPVPDGAVRALADHGVATVHRLQHDLLAPYAAEAWGAALAQLVDTVAPGCVVGPASGRGSDVLCNAAAELDLPLASNCTEVRPVDGGLELTRLRWGGMLLEDARLTAATALVTVSPHHVAPEPAEGPGAATVVEHTPELTEAHTIGRVRDRTTRTEGVGLATAPVVVAGGRGVGSAEGFAPLEELAGLLGGAVGCSRVATNNGWRSHSDQVGQTGTRVAPDLYVALGISGATQHWVGCMSSKRILAVNTDPEAPMVTRAHYAVLGDLHAVVPALIDEIRRRRGGG